MEEGLMDVEAEAKLAERRQALTMGLAFIVVVMLVVGLLGWVLI
jgi:hypothetical protein